MIVSIVFGSYEVAGENGLADFGRVQLHDFGCKGKKTVYADDLDQNEDQDVSAEYEFHNLTYSCRMLF